ncbi:hypothetical protein ASC77_07765 [Nocardioides sp. Root1257]|uniref:pentapeptide repeat-containing protein n=1 Tax=unclassified Nocardioides TaxID=2615069 RepID=UPI0006F27444|nr:MULTISPECIES: pentapeptide repeat-containing protein [unclassified Nocardioides]KQW48628.1 hypothetical protein ASC77_07765 [Nocardioides sp. Root1257]KRC47804.1 hypothetical protein ASE24_07770 [Nocardioides sp. Root224]
MPSARASVTPPQIGPLRFGDLESATSADLVRNADLEGARYDDVVVSQLDLSGARLDHVQVVGLSADEADLRGGRLIEVELDRVDLTVVRAARSDWRDVRVTGRIGSFEAYEAQWRSVHFVGCKLSFVNLRGAGLLDVAFTDCIIEELDLLSAVVRRVGLTDTRVGHLSVRDSELQDLDLRGATLASIDGVLHLRGATISPGQLDVLAPVMAESLGLNIEA